MSTAVRAEGCRVIGLAAIMDDDVFHLHAAVLGVISVTCADEPKTRVGHLTLASSSLIVQCMCSDTTVSLHFHVILVIGYMHL